LRNISPYRLFISCLFQCEPSDTTDSVRAKVPTEAFPMAHDLSSEGEWNEGFWGCEAGTRVHDIAVQEEAGRRKRRLRGGGRLHQALLDEGLEAGLRSICSVTLDFR
jgi:hypothetical protein